MTNAIKFTNRGRVGVSIRREAGDLYRFEVVDTGIGIPADRQELLFRSFSQVDRSIARKYGGTGLGLAISKRLAEAMGGTIGVTSVPEVGSAFWFTARLPESASPTESPAPHAEARSAARRILVVDDNATNQIVAKGLLRQDGHVAILAGDGAAAVAAVKASSFDLVLMDMQMPVMDGLEATRRIRGLDGPACAIPIVALTANAMAEQVARCREAGMNDHLAKPIDRESLRRVVALWATNHAEPAQAAAVLEQTPSAAAASGPEFTVDALLEIVGGDHDMVAIVLRAAAESIAADMGCIEAAIEEHSERRVTEAAHRLKGTFGDLRARALADVSARLERASRDGFWDTAPELFAELVRRVATLSAELEAYTNSVHLAQRP